MDNREISKCPCIKCICIPVCRHKTYFKLKDECELVHQYIMDEILVRGNKGFSYRIEIKSAIKPTEWTLNFQGEITETKLRPGELTHCVQVRTAEEELWDTLKRALV